MALDLSSTERQLEELMRDLIRIERLARDADKTFNPATGQYTIPPPEIIYEGIALISTTAQEPRPRELGGVPADDNLYQCRWPHDHTVRVRRDDRIICVQSEGSPQLEGVEFRVESEIHSTYAVSRRVHMTLIEVVID